MPNKEMLLIPGPTPVVDEIYEALSRETMSHTDMRLAQQFKEALDITKEIYKTDGEVFVVAGSGTLAMEIALLNTVAPKEKLLIISHGYFGDRFIGVAEALGIEADVLQAKWGERVQPEEVEEKLKNGNYKAVTVTHADTSTGVMADVDALVPVVKKYGVLFILDGVCASAGIEEDMSKEYGGPDKKIDVILTASQKAIGVPPGLAIVTFAPSALEVREKLGKVSSYYCDIKNWINVMREPSKYFATHPVNMIYAYHAAMQIIKREGIPQRFQRHTALGKSMRAALRTYGLQILAKEEVAAHTISCMLYPEGVNDGDFRNTLKDKGVIVAGLLGELSGKGFRMGHMGNTSNEVFLKALAIIGETLQEQGLQVDVKKAQETFTQVFEQYNKLEK